MMKNPLIEIAEDFEYEADLVIDLPEAANRELRNARILRAAAAIVASVCEMRNAPRFSELVSAYEDACEEKRV